MGEGGDGHLKLATIISNSVRLALFISIMSAFRFGRDINSSHASAQALSFGGCTTFPPLFSAIKAVRGWLVNVNQSEGQTMNDLFIGDAFTGNPFTIRHHRLYQRGKPIPFLRSPNQSAKFAPRGIILHDTAGRLDKGHAVHWFLKAEARASAHVTIERDGSVTQQVGFDRRAWHAGKSSYRGEEDVNGFAFGIELVNPGKCVKLRDGRMQSWFKARYRDGIDDLSFAFANTKAHGKGWWLDYSEAQLQSVTALCQQLIARYDLAFIAGHWEVAPGRKIDPNPLFPLSSLRSTLFGESGAYGGPVLLADANLRRWPSYHDNIIKVLDQGTPIHVIRSGTYNALGHPEIWHMVEAADQQGWVHHSVVDLD